MTSRPSASQDQAHETPELQLRYGGWLASLHPETWMEMEAMARTAGKGLKIDLEPAIEAMGVDRIIETLGIDRVIEQLGDKEVTRRIGLDRWLASLSPAERRELKRRLQ